MTCLRKISIRTFIMMLSFFTFICLFSSSSIAKTCQLDIAAPAVTLSTFEGKIKISNGHSSRQLGTKFGGHGKMNLRAGWVTRGLTKTQLESQIEVSITYRQISKNRFCIGLSKVAARVGYRHFKVFVARKLKPGSCEYKTTMAHEQNHVSIYRDQLQKYLPRFKQQLNKSSIGLKPIISSSSAVGHQYFLRKLNSGFKRVFKQMNKETDRKQGRMDTAKNYRREQALCPDR